MTFSGTRTKIRVIFSLALCFLLIFEMLYDLTGNMLHELVSVAFAIVLIVHIVLARKWIIAACRGSLRRQSRKVKNIIRLIIMLVILIATIVLAITSILISELLEEAGFIFPLYDFDRFTLRIIHTISAYILCASTVIHIALHYVPLIKVLHIPYDPSRRKTFDSVVGIAATIGVIALGISCYNDISQRERGAGEGNRQGDGNGRNRKETSENTENATEAVEDGDAKVERQGKGRQDGSGKARAQE